MNCLPYSTSAMTAGLLAATTASLAMGDAPSRWTMHELSNDSFDSMAATDLNNNGVMTGHAVNYAEPWWQHTGFLSSMDGPGSDSIFEMDQIQSYGIVINDAGVAAGYSNDDDQLIRFELVDGAPVATALGDLESGSFTPRLNRINELGMICGVVPKGGGIFRAFQWTSQDGLQTIMTGSNVQVTDMNEAGEVVGGSNDGAFWYDDGHLEMLPGDVALAIDDEGRVLLQDDTAGSSLFYQYDLNTGDQELIAEIDMIGWAGAQAIANESGMVALSWQIADPDNPVEELARLARWTAEDGLMPMELSTPIVAIQLVAMNESGMLLYNALQQDYELVAFFAHGLHNNSDFAPSARTFGFECDLPYTAVDLNDAGQILYRLSTDNSYGTSVLLNPARAGDTNGDGAVGIDDLLQIIGSWGEYTAEDTCGNSIIADLDGDGEVNISDLLACIGDWG